MGLDLRISEGELRFYEPRSNRKLLSHQETELARQQAQQSLFLAIARLQEMGLTPQQIADSLNLSVAEVEKILAQS